MDVNKYIFLIPFLLEVASAELPNVSRNARTFESIHSSATMKGLGHTCLATTIVRDSLPCNPALLPGHEKPYMGVQGLLSNGYSNLEKTQQLFRGQIDQQVIDSLFSQEPVIQLELNSEIYFVSKAIALKYSPLNLREFIVVRNETNPDVFMYAVKDEVVAAQVAWERESQISVGAEFKYVNRQYIKRSFKLLDLATQAGKDALKPVRQNTLFFQPGIVYTGSQKKWRTSLLVANIPLSPVYTTDLNEPIEAQAGVSIEMPVTIGKLLVEVNYRSTNYDVPSENKFHLATSYHYGSMYLLGSVDYDGVSSGIYYEIEKLNAAIIYSSTEVPWQNKDSYTQAVYVQAGWQI